MIKIRHKRKGCIGCYYCAEKDPLYWQMDADDGKANLVGSHREKDDYVLWITPDEKPVFDQVIDICPVNIIRIEH